MIYLIPIDLNTKADEWAIAPKDLPNQLEFNFSTSEAVREQSTTMYRRVFSSSVCIFWIFGVPHLFSTPYFIFIPEFELNAKCTFYIIWGIISCVAKKIYFPLNSVIFVLQYPSSFQMCTSLPFTWIWLWSWITTLVVVCEMHTKNLNWDKNNLSVKFLLFSEKSQIQPRLTVIGQMEVPFSYPYICKKKDDKKEKEKEKKKEKDD